MGEFAAANRSMYVSNSNFEVSVITAILVASVARHRCQNGFGNPPALV